MSYLSKPTTDGIYRIKVINQDLYIESVPGPKAGLKLSSPSYSSEQKWILEEGKPDVWTMTSVDNNLGVTYVKGPGRYWGYGYPCPQSGSSQNWSILETTDQGQKFSKIKLEGTSDCFDSVSPGSDGVHFYPDQKDLSSGPKQCYVFEEIKEDPDASLDVLFLQDFTGSQTPYIESARKGINQIYTMLLNEGRFTPSNLRFGLVAFRDHPPQEKMFVTKVFPFDAKPGSLADNLASLTATGGGDGPECQSDALAEALNAKWNDKATKVAILITDSPPHGIGEDGDGFPGGCPSQIDPLDIASKMAEAGITLYVLACESTLSQYYKNARDFYTGLTRKTGGNVFDLGNPDALPTFVSGCVRELLDNEHLITKFGNDVLTAKNNEKTPDAIAEKLHDEFAKEGLKQHALVTDIMHVSNPTGDKNADTWFEEKTLAGAQPKLQQNQGNRIHEYFLSGGAQSEPAIHLQPISLTQVKNVVQKCLVRK